MIPGYLKRLILALESSRSVGEASVKLQATGAFWWTPGVVAAAYEALREAGVGVKEGLRSDLPDYVELTLPQCLEQLRRLAAQPEVARALEEVRELRGLIEALAAGTEVAVFQLTTEQFADHLEAQDGRRLMDERASAGGFVAALVNAPANHECYRPTRPRSFMDSSSGGPWL